MHVVSHMLVREMANVGGIVIVLWGASRLVAAVHHHRTWIRTVAPTIAITVDGAVVVVVDATVARYFDASILERTNVSKNCLNAFN